MRLISCRIENFGKLSDREFVFGGFTLIKEDNGWGKTTLAAFIAAMFYGFPKRAEKDRYKPWQGGVFGGSLDFEMYGKTFRIERDFGDKNAFRLIDIGVKRGVEKIGNVFVDAKNLGEVLFGLNKESFERSAYVPQGDIVSEKVESGVGERLRNLICATDGQHNFTKAVEKLTEAEKLIDSPRARTDRLREISSRLRAAEQKIEECEVFAQKAKESREEIEEYEKRLASLEDEVLFLQKQIDAETEKKALREANQNFMENKMADLQSQRQIYKMELEQVKTNRGNKFVLVLLGILTLGLYFILAKSRQSKRVKEAEDKLRLVEKVIADCKNEMQTQEAILPVENLYQAKRQKEDERTEIIRQMSVTESRVATEESRAEDRADFQSEKEICLEEKNALLFQLESIREAKRFLSEANDNLSAQYLTPLREQSRLLLQSVGQELQMDIDAEGEITVREAGRDRKLLSFSAGSRELVALCMRFALIDVLFPAEAAPCILLDDPFVNLDDKKLAAAADLVKKLSKKYQIIYLTCHNSRKII